jgi:hypothetical protein
MVDEGIETPRESKVAFQQSSEKQTGMTPGQRLRDFGMELSQVCMSFWTVLNSCMSIVEWGRGVTDGAWFESLTSGAVQLQRCRV